MSSDSDVPESYGLLGNTAVDSTEPDSLSKQLKMLNSAISDKPPYCSGVLPVSAEDLILYYGKDKIAKFVSFYVLLSSATLTLMSTVLGESISRMLQMSNLKSFVLLVTLLRSVARIRMSWMSLIGRRIS